MEHTGRLSVMKWWFQMMINRRRALLSQENKHVLIKIEEGSSITPRIFVDTSKIKTIMFTGIQDESNYKQNILLCSYNYFWLGTDNLKQWHTNNISCDFNIDFKDWANGRINTVSLTDVTIGRSRGYITLIWDDVWAKEHFIEEIKFFDYSNSLVCHVVATEEGKFLEKVSGRVLENYSDATPNASITNKPFEILII